MARSQQEYELSIFLCLPLLTGIVTSRLAHLFPLGSGSKEGRQGEPAAEDDEEESIETMLGMATRYLKSRAIVSDPDSDVPRPGSSYARYRQESDLPDTARVFYETAAKVTGMSLPTLVRCVSQAEFQTNKWLEDQRRLKYSAEHPMESPGGSDVENMEEFSDQDMLDEDNN